MTAITVSEFRVGEVLGRSIAILGRNLVPFGILALIFTWPLLFFSSPMAEDVASGTTSPYGSGAAGSTDPFTAGEVAVIGGVVLAAVVVAIVLYMLSTSTMVYGTFQDLRGRRIGVATCVRRGLATVFPVLGVALLYTLAVMLGSVALIVPGVMLYTAFWVAIPVAVVERPGVVASLKRSAALTKGHRWRIFGMIMVLALLNGVVDSTLQMSSNGAAGTAAMAVHAVVSYLATAFFIAFGAVTTAVAYHDLRLVKEGLGIDEIAAVFD